MALLTFIRPARKGDGEAFLEWSRDIPGFDPEVAYHPGIPTVAAYNKQRVVAFMPINQPFFMETIAFNPEATSMEKASAMSELVKFLVSQCYIKGVPEVYFLGTDDMTDKFALNHVFEQLPYKLYRVKVSDLEPHQETLVENCNQNSI